jgi:hypothetical protein
VAVAVVAALVEILQPMFLVLVRVAAVMDQIMLTHQMELLILAVAVAVLVDSVVDHIMVVKAVQV